MAEAISLPSNYEAECVVLGCCFISSSSASIVTSSCDEDCFTDQRNKIVYKAIKNLVGRGEEINASIVNDLLVTSKQDEIVGGIEYLVYLVEGVLNPDAIDSYIKIVKEQAVLRKLLLTVKDVEKDYATGSVKNIGDFVSSVSSKINAIANERDVAGFQSSKEVAAQVQNTINELTNHQNNGLIGIDTGYKKLNQMTHGWKPQDLIIVAARPSLGKTALTLNLAYNAALRTNRPVAFFSLEMPATGLMNRLIANRAMVSNDAIQTGFLNSSEKIKIASAIEEISSVPLYFDDAPNSLLGDIIAKATRMKHDHPDLAMICIDYLGKIRTNSSGKVESREREVSLCTSLLKQMARELDVPVILICQINRNAESNDGKRPSMANLRESGSIEADADQVLLLYREDYYTAVGQSVAKKNSFGKEVPQENNQQKPKPENDNSVMDIIIAKNRNGKVGTTKLLFSKQFSRFDDLSEEFEGLVEQHEKAMANSGDFLE